MYAVKWKGKSFKGRSEMKWKKFRIMLIALIFTPVTTLTMLNPAMQHPGKFSSFNQMMRYYRSIERDGLERHMTPLKMGCGKDISLERNGLKVRM